MSDNIRRIKAGEEIYNLDAKFWGGFSINDIKSVNGQPVICGDSDGDYDIITVQPIIKTTYNDLVSLRDNNELIPGQQYRITDYMTTVDPNMESACSADHKFDIIVIADNEYTLNEKARAINHPSIIEGAIKVKYAEENFSYIYVRTPEFDSNDMYAWAYVNDSGNKDVCFVDLEDYDTADLIFTNTLTPNIGDILDMSGEDVELLSIHYDADYFSTCNLAAWELWYCLDNNKSRFDWADEENGTGVIYRMIDEWGNDCPYDFKNIMFKRWLWADGAGVADEESGDFYTYCYTFSWEDSENGIMDASIFGNNGDLLNDEGQISGVYGNIIGVYNSYDGDDESPQSTKQYLNDIVFFSTQGYDGLYYGCCSNTFGNDCRSNTFGNNCYENIFGERCSYNTFGDDCNSNTFSYGCSSNTFGAVCSKNTFGNYCSSNTFNNECYSNTFGNNCFENTFGNDCYKNTFSDSCYSNTFGNYCFANTFNNECYSNKFDNSCRDNTFGNNCHSNKFGIYCHSNTFCIGCHSNTFGNTCYSNKFGNGCTSNTFGNNCHSNKFGSYCHSNKFGSWCVGNTFVYGCRSNKFGSSSNIKSYYRHIIFDNGNSYIMLNCTATTSSSKYYQNVRIGLGVNNTTTYKTISDGNVGQSYETLYKPAESQVILI